jgi:hypothetical protein
MSTEDEFERIELLKQWQGKYMGSGRLDHPGYVELFT